MIVKRVEGVDLAHIVETDGKCYYVDSSLTPSGTYETNVFQCDKKGKIKNHDPLIVKHYDSDHDMWLGHYTIIENLKEAIRYEHKKSE